MRVDHHSPVPRSRGLLVWSEDYPEYHSRLKAMSESASLAFENAELLDLIPLSQANAPKDYGTFAIEVLEWDH